MRSGAVLAGAAAALTVGWALTMRLAFGAGYISAGDARDNAVAVVVLIALAAAVALFSQLGRYVVVLFAAAFYPCGLVLARYAGVVGDTFLHGRPVTFTVLYLPPLVAAGAIVAAAYRGRHRRPDNRMQGTSARA